MAHLSSFESPPKPEKLAKEYIPGRPKYPFSEALAAQNLALPAPHLLTWDQIDLMRTDATIDASIELLKELILAEKYQVIAKAFDHDKEKEKADKAHEIADFVAWALPANFLEVMSGLLEAVYYGYTVAELIYETVTFGPYKGKLRLHQIKVKDRNAIELVVDKYWNVTGVRAVSLPEKNVFPREKFVIFTLRKKGEDPRGQTSLRQVFGAWRFKQEIWPAYVRFMRTCAVPSLLGYLPPDARPQARLNPDGTPVLNAAGQPVYDQPAQALLTALEGMENATVAVLANGTEVQPIETPSNAPLFADAVEVANKEIVMGLLRQTRATTEAQHSSKADSETGRSLLSFFVAHMRQLLAQSVYVDIVTPLVMYNYGVEAFDLIPNLELGETDRFDWGSDARSAAMLGASLTNSQWDAVTTMLGLPLPLPDEERPQRRGTITNTQGDTNRTPAQDQQDQPGNEPPKDNPQDSQQNTKQDKPGDKKPPVKDPNA